MDKGLKAMRRESKVMTPGVVIGKNGLTDQVIKNIKNEIAKNKMVKVKIFSTYLGDKDKSEVFSEIVEKTGAKVVHTLGFTITLTRK